MNLEVKISFAILTICLMSGLCFAVQTQPPAVQTQPEVVPLENKPESATIEKHQQANAEDVNLPADASPRLEVSQINIVGNALITTEKLLANVPDVFNASAKPIDQAPANLVFDLRPLKQVIDNPGQVQEVSTHSIQGLTRYILSVYQKKNYSGVYVYVPAKDFADGKLKDNVLTIQVLEASVSDVKVVYHDVNGIETEKGKLRVAQVLKWSPVWAGQVANKKKIDDYINLLNLNPDRRVYATVAAGAEPNSLAIKYDIYEASPWHYFIQLDNAGTDDRKWAPRLGLINTNLLGFDDKFTGVVQGKPEKEVEDEYSVYGSYDFPLCTQKLRLNLFAAHSEFDVAAAQGFDFLGRGSSYGGTLRYNACQANGWFFDLLGTLRRDNSEFTPSLFAEELGSDVRIDLLGWGIDIHRSNDMASSSITLNYLESIGGSSQESFTQSRAGAERDFAIWTFSAAHRQFIDLYRIHRLLGSITYIWPDERLAPVEMTSFGGLYTVRGYEESEIVADGGTIASIQYEYDIVKACEHRLVQEQKATQARPCLRKLAPVVFFDYGRAVIEDPVEGEDGTQLLYSVGTGLLAELGDHFSSGLYYGWPLKSTDETDNGEGRLSVNLMMRW